MRKHHNTHIWRLHGFLGDVALVPVAAYNLAHKYTDIGLEELHISNLIAEETSVTLRNDLPRISLTPGTSLLTHFDLGTVKRLAWCRFLRGGLTVSRGRKLCERACTDGCPKECRLACNSGTSYDSCLQQGRRVSGPRLRQLWRNKRLPIHAKLTSVTRIEHKPANYYIR